MIYRGYDLDKFKEAIFALNDYKDPKDGVWKISDASRKVTNNFFRSQKDFKVFATLIDMGYDLGTQELIANTAVKFENGKIVGDDNAVNQLGDIGDFFDFTKEANNLTFGFATSLPVIGEILSGLSIINQVIGVFTTEARTNSFNMQNKLSETASGYNWGSQPAGSINKHIRAKSHTVLYWLSMLRPACRTGSESCSVEHVRYDLRGQIAIASCNLTVELVERYFNEDNFPEFINNWLTIQKQISAIGGEVTINTGGTLQEQSSGCFPLALLLASVPTLIIIALSLL